MKTGTFTESRHSLVRVMIIFFWFQLALMLGIFCSYVVIRVSMAYAIGQIDAHPNQPASIDWVPNVGRIGFWLFAIGLPVVALILGICGILPGTRRKDRYDHVA